MDTPTEVNSMRRLLPFAALLVLSLLGSDARKEYDDRTEQGDDRLQGAWKLEAVKSHL